MREPEAKNFKCWNRLCIKIRGKEKGRRGVGQRSVCPPSDAKRLALLGQADLTHRVKRRIEFMDGS